MGPSDHQRHDPRGVAAAAMAMVAWAGSGVLAKGIDMGGLVVVSYRMWIYVALVLAWSRLRGRPVTRHTLRVSLWGGLALGVDLALFFSAVKLTTVANATVIGAMQPVLALVIGFHLFGERPRRVDVALAMVAIGGVVLVVLGSAGAPEWSPLGDLAAIGALVFFTAYFVFSKQSRSLIEATEYTAATALIAALVNVPITLLSGQDLGPPSTASWIGLILLAVGPGFIGHSLMNWSFGRIPLWLGSTFTLALPVTASLLAWAFLGEQVSALQAVGIGVVVVALAGIVLSPARPVPVPGVETIRE